MRSLIALPLLPLAFASALPSIDKRDSGCSSVHIILARGNDEPYPGRQGALVTSICNKFDSCDYEDIKYDIPSDPYCTTVTGGAVGGLAQIKAYNKQCPNSLIVLSGYSQGGQVIGDILGGGGGTFYDGCVQPTNAGLDPDSAPGKQIAAVLLWGDIRHTASQSYNIMSGATKNGAFPRSNSQLSGLSNYASVLRSWCVDTDPICAHGNDGLSHTHYFDYYSDDAAKWVKEKLGNPPPSKGGSSSSAASSSAPTATTSSNSSSSNASTSNSASATTFASSTISSNATTTAFSSSFPTDIPEETNLAYTPSSTPASTLVFSATYSVTTPSITPVSITATTKVAAASATSSSKSTTTKTANAAPTMGFGMNLIGLAVLGGALVL